MADELKWVIVQIGPFSLDGNEKWAIECDGPNNARAVAERIARTGLWINDRTKLIPPHRIYDIELQARSPESRGWDNPWGDRVIRIYHAEACST